MDELVLMNYEEAEPGTTDGVELATVVSVGTAGVRLLIDGNEEAGEKEYRVNTGQLLKAGDRVKIRRISGSYVVEYAVGDPMARFAIPPGGTDGQALVKDGTDDYKVKWSDGGGGGDVSELANGNYRLILSNSGVLAAQNSSRKVTLGTQQIPFNGCYLGGEMHIGTATSDKIGFFGHTVAARQSVSDSATVAALITALKAYGLIN